MTVMMKSRYYRYEVNYTEKNNNHGFYKKIIINAHGPIHVEEILDEYKVVNMELLDDEV